MNSSSFISQKVPSAEGMQFAIVVSKWNDEITESLYQSAFETLLKQNCKKENIIRYDVPGSFELVAGAKFIAERHKADAVICLGCVIQGETRHFEFICNAVANGIIQLNITYNIPFIFGVLTTDNLEQAKERSGGKP